MSYAAALGPGMRRNTGTGMARLAFPLLFLTLVLPVLLASALLVPTGEVPDEVAHIVRANGLLHGFLIGTRVPTTDRVGHPVMDGGVTANPAMITAGFAFPPGVPKVLTRERLRDLYATPWADSVSFISIPNTAVYFPLFYVPAAIGLGAAHVAGLGPYQAILAARLCNVVVFAALGLAAMMLAVRARGLIFATLALPMTVSVAGSCNQDGVLIATACLAAALLTRPGPRLRWSGIIALALVIALKPVYLPLALLAGLASPGHRLGVLNRAAAVIVAMLPALLWFAIAQHYAVVPFIRGEPYQAGPLWPGPPGQMFGTTDAQAQLRVFLHDPFLLLTLPYNGLRHGLDLADGLVGILGTLDVVLPLWLYNAWFAALGAVGVAALFGGERDAPGWPIWASLLGLLCVAASVIAVFDGQYLSWTLVGASSIAGVQGRYGIPLLPMIGLALPCLRLSGGSTLRTALEMPALLAAAAGLVVTPVLLVTTYYLR